MPEKLGNSVTQWPILGLTRRVGVLICLTFLAMLLVWSIDQSTVTILLGFWKYPREFSLQRVDNFTSVNLVNNSDVVLPNNGDPDEGLGRIWGNVGGLEQKLSAHGGDEDQFESNSSRFGADLSLSWVAVELERNYSSNVLGRWLEPGGEPCKDSKTIDIKVVNFDDESSIELSTGAVHEVVFETVDEFGNPRCLGGDYFEIDLSGEFWKSRPPIKDMGNGTYSFTLQVHPDFAGVYNLTVILLFRHFEGLKFSTARFGYDKELRRIPISFAKSVAKLPELHICEKSDFERDVWAGRWTRHGKNDGCEISHDGRFRCLESDHPCTTPWCNGSLGLLESNGWVYSAHCSFRLFSHDDAWNCLNNRWIFFWGDSNHVDSIRNLLFFFLGVPYQELEVVSRHFDEVFTNPKDGTQSVRITNLFNGHWNMTMNYQGLDSLSNEGYRDLLKSYFNGSSVPDTVVFNSGLHDGIHWRSVRRFIAGAEYAAAFWKEMMEDVKKKGLEVSNFIFRSTITTGGYARILAFNPSKMEVFNGILLEKLRTAGLVTGVIDDFDITWAWHFDNRCNDGVHYGRFPEKKKWRDGQIGHQYFVDLMLGQVLLNSICAR